MGGRARYLVAGLLADGRGRDRLVDSEGHVVHHGGWAFATFDRWGRYEGPTFFGKADLAGAVAADAELQCRNRR